MAKEQVNRLVEQLRAAQRGFEQAAASVSASDFYKAPAEGEWTTAEIVAHMCESPPAFMAKVAQMAAGREPLVGRDEVEQRLRLEEVSRHAGDGKMEAMDRLRSVSDQVADTLQGLNDEQLGYTGRHPDRGLVAAWQEVQSIIKHYEDHTRQIYSGLTAMSSGR